MKQRDVWIRRGVAGAAAVAVIATVAVVVPGGDGADPRTVVTATFEDASPLVPGNEVKLAGVTVGTISDIALQDGLAQVSMELDESALPIYQDASVDIVSKDLLGERFLVFDRGSPEAGTAGDFPVLPPERSTRSADLQDVLDTVDDPTGTALAMLVTALGEGADGNGEEIAAAAAALAPAMEQTGELARLLGEQNEVLTRLVDSAEPVATALAADEGRSLDQLVGSTEAMLAATAAERPELQAALERLPATLGNARRTLAQLSGVADNTAATLGELRPITDDLTTIDDELRRFADAADPALASLPPVLERAERMLDEAAPLTAALRSGGPELRSVAGSARPLFEDALSLRLTNLMNFLQGWSLSTSSYDAISHYFRASAPVTPKALGQLAGGTLPGAPDAPVPDLPLPAPPQLPFPPPEGDEQDQPQPPPADDSATGLTEEQEQDMLGQLLGGGR